MQEAATRFQLIGEAYDVLSSLDTRAIYDQFGFTGLNSGDNNNDEGIVWLCFTLSIKLI
jgi:curved DNA-binding protein CbpA